jgi:hypothetical protein
MKLFTIGDSLSQGFMSGAGARTDLCYSTMIARSMGLRVGTDYVHPEWPAGGHPIDLERVLRRLQSELGRDVRGLSNWAHAARVINRLLDDVEDYYEHGPGAAHRPYPGGVDHFDNVASWGYTVADAWQVTPRLCLEEIAKNRFGDTFGDLNPFPSAGFYRTALSVLNPTRDPVYDGFCALDWLDWHATTRAGGGVENVLLWLGANNILGAVLRLVVDSTDRARGAFKDKSHQDKRKYNVWKPEHFREEYAELLDRVDDIMQRNVSPDWDVFVGTVPSVTIPPVTKAMGNPRVVADPHLVLRDGARYFDRYVLVFLSENPKVPALTFHEIYDLDHRISKYNEAIRELVAEKNEAHRSRSGRDRYHIVEIGKALLEAAYKRNDGDPPYKFPKEIKQLQPRPDTRYYRCVRGEGKVCEGGIFSLDGVHPTAIGQGLVAHEFRKTMAEAGVDFAHPLDWTMVTASDQLWQKPLPLVEGLFDHEKLASWAFTLQRWFANRGLNAD